MSSRRMSLLPRATLHSDSKHVCLIGMAAASWELCRKWPHECRYTLGRNYVGNGHINAEIHWEMCLKLQSHKVLDFILGSVK
jgi:hypothetical protein